MHRLFHRALPTLLSVGLILGSYRGFVALFDEGSTEPRQIYPYKTESLPLADQQELAKGIPVPSEKALTHMLEDYMS